MEEKKEITKDMWTKFVLESNKVFEKSRYESDESIYEDDNGNRGKGNALVMVSGNTEIYAAEAAETGIPFLFYADDVIS